MRLTKEKIADLREVILASLHGFGRFPSEEIHLLCDAAEAFVEKYDVENEKLFQKQTSRLRIAVEALETVVAEPSHVGALLVAKEALKKLELP